MNYTLKIGDVIVKAFTTGRNLTNAGGEWLWDKIVKDISVPDIVKEVGSEYLALYYTKFNSVPNTVQIIENGDTYEVVDGGNTFTWTKTIPALLPVLVQPQQLNPSPQIRQVYKATPTVVKRKRANKQATKRTSHDLKSATSDIKSEEVSIFHPLYFPYVFAYQHKFLWAFFVITRFIINGTIKLASMAIPLGAKIIYWTFMLLWLVMKYGLIITVATIPIILRISLIIMTFGIVDIGGKKKRRR